MSFSRFLCDELYLVTSQYKDDENVVSFLLAIKQRSIDQIKYAMFTKRAIYYIGMTEKLMI